MDRLYVLSLPPEHNAPVPVHVIAVKPDGTTERYAFVTRTWRPMERSSAARLIAFYRSWPGASALRVPAP